MPDESPLNPSLSSARVSPFAAVSLTPEPSRDDIPFARPVEPAIGVARPIGLPPTFGPFADPPHPMLMNTSTRVAALCDIAFVVVGLLLCEAAAIWLLAPALGYTYEDIEARPEEATQELLVPMLAVRTAAAIGLLALVLRVRRQRAASVGLTTRGWGWNIIIGAASPLVAYAIIMPVMIAVVLASPEARRQMEENADRLHALLPRVSMWLFGPIMAVVGLWEELFFRGFLMTRLRRVTGSWTAAVVLSTACFTLAHLADQTAAALIPITILSLVFSGITIWRKSIMPAIIGHAVFNFSQVVWMHFALRPTE